MEKSSFNNQENGGSRDQLRKEVSGPDSLSERELLEKYGITPEQKQQFSQEMNEFLKDTYNSMDWDISQVVFTPKWINQGEVDFKSLSEMSADKKEFGEYITNPETAFLDYEALNDPEVINLYFQDENYQNWLKQNNRQNRMVSVMDYIHEVYKNTHYLPGIEYQRYLFENQGKIPDSLKDGNYYFLPGSTFGRSGGESWMVPYGVWSKKGWHRFSEGIECDWREQWSVVLFKKG